jgi:hypothetical protein
MDTPTPMPVSLLPAKAAGKMQPKPKQSEIINALVELKREAYIKERKELSDAYEAAFKSSGDALTQYVSENIKKLTLKSELGCRWGGVEITRISVECDLSFNTLPKDVQKKLTDYHDAKGNALVVKTDRVKLMLETPEIKSALKAMLKKMDGEDEPKAITV